MSRSAGGLKTASKGLSDLASYIICFYHGHIALIVIIYGHIGHSLHTFVHRCRKRFITTIGTVSESPAFPVDQKVKDSSKCEDVHLVTDVPGVGDILAGWGRLRLAIGKLLPSISATSSNPGWPCITFKPTNNTLWSSWFGHQKRTGSGGK